MMVTPLLQGQIRKVVQVSENFDVLTFSILFPSTVYGTVTPPVFEIGYRYDFHVTIDHNICNLIPSD